MGIATWNLLGFVEKLAEARRSGASPLFLAERKRDEGVASTARPWFLTETTYSENLLFYVDEILTEKFYRGCASASVCRISVVPPRR